VNGQGTYDLECKYIAFLLDIPEVETKACFHIYRTYEYTSVLDYAYHFYTYEQN
jgi:hypothetical protein